MSETLEYYPEAVLIDGRLAVTGAGRARDIVDGKTLSMLKHSQIRRPVMPEITSPHMKALAMATAQSRDIYPMPNSVRKTSAGSRQAVRRR